jgi:hypothetical protein
MQNTWQLGTSNPKKVTIVHEVQITHQGSNAEATVVQKLNQSFIY